LGKVHASEAVPSEGKRRRRVSHGSGERRFVSGSSIGYRALGKRTRPGEVEVTPRLEDGYG